MKLRLLYLAFALLIASEGAVSLARGGSSQQNDLRPFLDALPAPREHQPSPMRTSEFVDRLLDALKIALPAAQIYRGYYEVTVNRPKGLFARFNLNSSPRIETKELPLPSGAEVGVTIGQAGLYRRGNDERVMLFLTRFGLTHRGAGIVPLGFENHVYTPDTDPADVVISSSRPFMSEKLNDHMTAGELWGSQGAVVDSLIDLGYVPNDYSNGELAIRVNGGDATFSWKATGNAFLMLRDGSYNAMYDGLTRWRDSGNQPAYMYAYLGQAADSLTYSSNPNWLGFERLFLRQPAPLHPGLWTAVLVLPAEKRALAREFVVK